MPSSRFSARGLIVLLCATVLALGTAASAPRAATVRPFAPLSARRPPVQHVVIIVQENRSFDNLFNGYPGADTVTHGWVKGKGVVKLRPVSLASPYGIRHLSSDFFLACDGHPRGRNCKMDGFDGEIFGANAPRDLPYSYVPHGESRLYFEMARQYVLADRMFTSNIDASFVSHQYIIAGQSQRAVDLPTSPWGCPASRSDRLPTLKDNRRYGHWEKPCFDYSTLADELDARGLSWRYYADNGGGYIWLAYQAIRHIKYGPHWKHDAVTPSSRFFADIRRGDLAAVTWITPSCANSDHGGCGSAHGPDWVASLVNAIGTSPFWPTTTIFVMWDEWGGWYDHVPPPYADYDGLGIRVPLLVISPFAKRGYVSHVQYEHGSLLRYAEDAFALPRLAQSDSRANSPDPDCFVSGASVRAFRPFATTLGPRDFVAAPPDPRPPDES